MLFDVNSSFSIIAFADNSTLSFSPLNLEIYGLTYISAVLPAAIDSIFNFIIVFYMLIVLLSFFCVVYNVCLELIVYFLLFFFNLENHLLILSSLVPKAG